jgi:hypothetical protein
MPNGFGDCIVADAAPRISETQAMKVTDAA